MARINLLKPRQITTLPVGFHSDGSNLYLRVTGADRRAWIFRYMSGGKVRQIGLGSTIERSIVEARDLADKMRRALANGESLRGFTRQRPSGFCRSGRHRDRCRALTKMSGPGVRAGAQARGKSELLGNAQLEDASARVARGGVVA